MPAEVLRCRPPKKLYEPNRPVILEAKCLGHRISFANNTPRTRERSVELIFHERQLPHESRGSIVRDLRRLKCGEVCRVRAAKVGESTRLVMIARGYVRRQREAVPAPECQS